ncbi:MAG: pseudouridine synthase [Propionibacteriaceae bacterium]|nr:pseudouridine synthase [Propionibacteriaceae bacterium]
MRAFLVDRLGPLGAPGVDRMLAAGEFVDADGRPWTGDEEYQPHTFIWFHRELRAEPPVPFTETILYRDDRIVVADKPHFLSTIPRGRHVLESLVVRLRNRLDLPELGPAHRLDRLTAGVVLLTTQKRWRGAYQSLFERRVVHKTYRAIAPFGPALEFPLHLGGHIAKRRGSLQAELIADAPDNASTWLDLVERRGDWAEYRLIPHTGRTHQLRIQLNALGLPIVGDPLYPQVLDISIDDFTVPLRLLAESLEFVDPIDGAVRRFASDRRLDWPTTDAPRS